MKAKAIRAALRATATRAAAVRRASSKEGMSAHPPLGRGAVRGGGARSSVHGNLLPVRSIQLMEPTVGAGQEPGECAERRLAGSVSD